MDRVQESRRRSATRQVARTAPRSRRGMIRSLPFGVVFLSHRGRAAGGGQRAAGRHSAGPARASNRDIRGGHDPWIRDVSLATVTVGEGKIDRRRAILRCFPQPAIKNGLNSVAGHAAETMRAVHEWGTAAATVVTQRQLPKTLRSSAPENEPLGVRVRTVCRWNSPGGPRRRDGSRGRGTPRAG